MFTILEARCRFFIEYRCGTQICGWFKKYIFDLSLTVYNVISDLRCVSHVCKINKYLFDLTEDQLCIKHITV